MGAIALTLAMETNPYTKILICETTNPLYNPNMNPMVNPTLGQLHDRKRYNSPNSPDYWGMRIYTSVIMTG